MRRKEIERLKARVQGLYSFALAARRWAKDGEDGWTFEFLLLIGRS